MREMGTEGIYYGGYGYSTFHFAEAFRALDWDPPRVMGTAFMFYSNSNEWAEGLEGWHGVDQLGEDGANPNYEAMIEALRGPLRARRRATSSSRSRTTPPGPRSTASPTRRSRRRAKCATASSASAGCRRRTAARRPTCSSGPATTRATRATSSRSASCAAASSASTGTTGRSGRRTARARPRGAQGTATSRHATAGGPWSRARPRVWARRSPTRQRRAGSTWCSSPAGRQRLEETAQHASAPITRCRGPRTGRGRPRQPGTRRRVSSPRPTTSRSACSSTDAAASAQGPFVEVELEPLLTNIAVNVTAPTVLTHTYGRRMKDAVVAASRSCPRWRRSRARSVRGVRRCEVVRAHPRRRAVGRAPRPRRRRRRLRHRRDRHADDARDAWSRRRHAEEETRMDAGDADRAAHAAGRRPAALYDVLGTEHRGYSHPDDQRHAEHGRRSPGATWSRRWGRSRRSSGSEAARRGGAGRSRAPRRGRVSGAHTQDPGAVTSARRSRRTARPT